MFTWIKSREVVVDGAKEIGSEKLREHGAERKEWDGENNIEHMWERMKRAMLKVQEKCVAEWE